MIHKLCSRCAATCEPGKDRCAKHRRKDNRRPARQRGYDAKWERTRVSYLSHLAKQQGEPKALCECGCGQLATDVHHLDGMGPWVNNDFSNLEGLAHDCHSRRTATEQPGGWNR